jgi:L-threonylcarbamoyladenylate synthase
VDDIDALVTTDVERAVAALAAGGLVAMPTETVYGLGADATDLDAVARIFAVKDRPHDHPLIVHVAEAADVRGWIDDLSPAGRHLAAVAWPGPLTLIGRRTPSVPDAVTGGRDTVAVRVPAHPVAQELLQRFGRGVAAPSANRFGRVSPTTAAHVLSDLGPYLDPRRDVILDGGPSDVGVESTIVDCAVDPPQILRSGGIPDEHIAELLAPLTQVAPASGPARASGMLASHYAPGCRVVLVEHDADPEPVLAATPGAELLDLTADLPEYARSLYARLRAADDRGAAAVVAVLPPARGLGHAIRDRLRKAAAPRPGDHRAITSRGC